MSVLIPFLWLNNIPLDGYISFFPPDTVLNSFRYITYYEVNVIIIPHFIGEETEAQGGKATCSRLHSRCVAEPGSDCGQSASRVCILNLPYALLTVWYT